MAERPAERRSHPRADAKVPLLITCGAEPDAIAAQTSNLSCSGLYGNVPMHIPAFERVRVGVSLPLSDGGDGSAEPLEVEGIVVRSEPSNEEEERRDYGIAIFFPDISEEARTRIATYVSKQM